MSRLEFANFRRGKRILKRDRNRRALPDVADQCRPEARDTSSALVADAEVDDAGRTAVQ